MKDLEKKSVIGAVFFAVLGMFAVLSYKIYEHTNPEALLRERLFDDSQKISRAFFSPDDAVRDLLISLIDLEKSKISIAIYTLTDRKIADAILRADRRGVAIECVVDRSYGSDRYSKVHRLADAEIPIWVYRSALEERFASLMHNKFCIFDNVFDRSLVWTGSYNFTVRANDRNQENVVVLDNESLVEHFRKQFNILKSRSVQISGDITSNKENKPIQKNKKTSWIKKIFG